jgi:hypothetical protein
MRLTVEENPETIKRYAHVRPAPAWAGPRCALTCPGTSRGCTLKKGHTGPHVAHGAFKRVVAVWGGGAKIRKSREKIQRPEGHRVPGDSWNAGPLNVLHLMRWVGYRLLRKAPSVEEAFLLVLALAMAGFAIDWALRILGWR